MAAFHDDDTRIAFFRACENGQLEECNRLWRKRRSRDQQQQHGDSFSFYAFPIQNLPNNDDNDVETPTPRSDYGQKECPPLHAAAWNGHVEVVRFLVKNCGFDVNETVRMADSSSDWFQTALFRACETSTSTATNRETCCRILLESGADLWGCTPLAVWKGNAPLLQLLIDYGGNPEIGYPHRTNRECPPLHIAISQCQPDVLEILFENKCTFLKNGSLVPSLVEMMEKKKKSNNNNKSTESDDNDRAAAARVFQLIIQNIPKQLVQGDLLDLLRPTGRSASLASHENRMIAKELFKAGANSSEPLLAFLGRVHQGRQQYDQRYHLETVHFLIDNCGANPGDDFETCFHHTLAIADEKLMAWILQHWDIQFGGGGGSYQPIHMACCYPQLQAKSLKLLLKHRPDSLELPHHYYGGLLPIEIACQWDLDLDIVYTLLRHKPSSLLLPQQPPNQSRYVRRDGDSSSSAFLRPTKRQKR